MGQSAKWLDMLLNVVQVAVNPPIPTTNAGVVLELKAHW